MQHQKRARKRQNISEQENESTSEHLFLSKLRHLLEMAIIWKTNTWSFSYQWCSAQHQLVQQRPSEPMSFLPPLVFVKTVSSSQLFQTKSWSQKAADVHGAQCHIGEGFFGIRLILGYSSLLEGSQGTDLEMLCCQNTALHPAKGREAMNTLWPAWLPA